VLWLFQISSTTGVAAWFSILFFHSIAETKRDEKHYLEPDYAKFEEVSVDKLNKTKQNNSKLRTKVHANVELRLELQRTVAGGHLAHLHEWKESIALAIANREISKLWR